MDPSLGFLVNDALKLKVKIKVEPVMARLGQTEAEGGCRHGEETPADPSCNKPPSPQEIMASSISMAGTHPAEVKRCRASFRPYIICWPSKAHIASVSGAKSKQKKLRTVYLACALCIYLFFLRL